MDHDNHCRETLAQSYLGVQIMDTIGLLLFIYGLCTLSLWAVVIGLALFIIFVGHGH